MVFHLERLLLRGAHYRLLFMAAAVMGVATSGAVVLALIGQPEAFGEGWWWAFLRLTDPGYLGDDEGVGRRVLSTVITVAGYVLFMGALIAILTQWLHVTVARLQRGETPIVLKDHVLVLGMTPRTPVVLQELLRSDVRLRRFLGRRGARRLRLVVLLEHLDETVRAELLDRLGDLWDDGSIILRSGSPLVAEHLARVDFARASAILIPGGSEPGDAVSGRDADTIKTLLSIANHPDFRGATSPPHVVAEVTDPLLADIVGDSYAGAVDLIPSDAIVSRFIAQNLRHHGLSWVLAELLAFQRGRDLFYRSFPEVAGQTFNDVVLRVEGGVALGVVRRGESNRWIPHLAPPPDLVIEAEDRFVVVAADSEDILLGPARPPVGDRIAPPALGRSWPSPRRVLVLGWSRRVPTLIWELDTYVAEPCTIDLMSVLPIARREAMLRAAGLGEMRNPLRHLEGDYTNVSDLRRLDLRAYDNVLILGRLWMIDGESSDAQTILGYTILQDRLRRLPNPPIVLTELSDPDNASLFEDRPGELVLSPVFMAHVLAHIAVRPELRAVVDELFTVGGAELHYRILSDYGLEPGRHVFAALQEVGIRHGEIVVGVRTGDAPLDVRPDLSLAPAGAEIFDLGASALLLVLTTHPIAVSSGPSGTGSASSA